MKNSNKTVITCILMLSLTLGNAFAITRAECIAAAQTQLSQDMRDCLNDAAWAAGAGCIGGALGGAIVGALPGALIGCITAGGLSATLSVIQCVNSAADAALAAIALCPEE